MAFPATSSIAAPRIAWGVSFVGGYRLQFAAQLLEASVSDRLSAAVAARLREAIAAVRPGDPTGMLTLEEAGEALAVAMVGGDAATAASELDVLDLVVVELVTDQGGQTRAILSPDEAFTHPLIGRWASATPDAAIAEAMRAGALLTQVAAGSPRFLRVEIIEAGGKIAGAVAKLDFGNATATLYYGDPQAGGFPICTHHKAQGTALVQIGELLREGRTDGPVLFAQVETLAEETRH